MRCVRIYARCEDFHGSFLFGIDWQRNALGGRAVTTFAVECNGKRGRARYSITYRFRLYQFRDDMTDCQALLTLGFVFATMPHSRQTGRMEEKGQEQAAMDDLYTRWIAHVFDHPPQDPDWYFHTDVLFPVSDAEFVALFMETMQRAGTDLTRFDDVQVNSGLHYIFNNSCSNYVFQLIDADLPKEIKAAALLSIKHLYSDCLAVRCRPVLSHRDEPGATPLNDFCYMLWDVTPLGYWEGRPYQAFFYDTVLDVMEFALSSPNIACIESALHGLGHLHAYVPKQVEQIIDRFLHENQKQQRELLAYAENARSGCIL